MKKSSAKTANTTSVAKPDLRLWLQSAAQTSFKMPWRTSRSLSRIGSTTARRAATNAASVIQLRQPETQPRAQLWGHTAMFATTGQQNAVHSLSFDTDEVLLAASSADRVMAFQLDDCPADGDDDTTVPLPTISTAREPAVSFTLPPRVDRVAFMNSAVASSTSVAIGLSVINELWLVDLEVVDENRPVPAHCVRMNTPSRRVHDICRFGDRLVAACTQAGFVALWDPRQRELTGTRSFTGSHATGDTTRFANDAAHPATALCAVSDSLLAQGTSDGRVVVWDVRQAGFVAHLELGSLISKCEGAVCDNIGQVCSMAATRSAMGHLWLNTLGGFVGAIDVFSAKVVRGSFQQDSSRERESLRCVPRIALMDSPQFTVCPRIGTATLNVFSQTAATGGEAFVAGIAAYQSTPVTCVSHQRTSTVFVGDTDGDLSCFSV
jgi:WD40 repeat protein